MGKRDKAREYKRTTIRRLDLLSGNECAAPTCSKKLIAHDEKSIVSKICHIEAAGEEGPRFNPLMDDDQRRAYENLILLCDECHTIIDNKENEVDYPVELLRSWKSEHEIKNLRQNQSSPSALKTVVIAISDTDFENIDEDNESTASFSIANKIEHNLVQRHCALIDEYSPSYGRLNKLYKELESNGSLRKDRLLRNIRNIYVKVKGQYVLNGVDALEVVRQNADDIFDDVQEELLQHIGSDIDLDIGDLFFAVSVIMVDGFIRCKILEEPPKK